MYLGVVIRKAFNICRSCCLLKLGLQKGTCTKRCVHFVERTRLRCAETGYEFKCLDVRKELVDVLCHRFFVGVCVGIEPKDGDVVASRLSPVHTKYVRIFVYAQITSETCKSKRCTRARRKQRLDELRRLRTQIVER